MSRHVDSWWKEFQTSHLKDGTHLYCICMKQTLQVEKEHPEYLEKDSGFNPCERCGTWGEHGELCNQCEIEIAVKK